MTRVLIPTYLDDIHATAVAIGLRAKGHEPVLWHGADLPIRQQSSIAVSPRQGLHWEVSGAGIDLADESFDVVWWRRPTRPVLPDDLHSGDRHIARRTCTAHQDALWELVAPGAFWVNRRWARWRASIKPLQLQEAVRAGLTVPETLFSNDPREIRRFLDEHEGQTVCKSYVTAQWRTEDGTALLFTSDIAAEDLPDDDTLRLSAAIFQRKVPKAHELRVTFMGDFVVTAKILSQEDELSRSDWRLAFLDLKIEKAGPLPPAVHRACQELMRRLGIVFGCFDFVVTPQGEHVFLEVNESGQFLWMEQIAPEVQVLDPFCEFLARGRADFDWKPEAGSVRFADVHEEALAEMEEDARIHNPRVFEHTADDSGRRSDGIATLHSPIYEHRQTARR